MLLTLSNRALGSPTVPELEQAATVAETSARDTSRFLIVIIVVTVKPSVQPNRHSAFAVTAPGLEPICARELAGLGIDGTVEEGGVAWSGPLESVARANLWLRTASRVIVRVAEFRALTFFELERHANKLNWKRFVARGGRVEFRVTCRKSRLYHSDAVAQRFARTVAVGRLTRPGPAGWALLGTERGGRGRDDQEQESSKERHGRRGFVCNESKAY